MVTVLENELLGLYPEGSAEVCEDFKELRVKS